MEINDPNYNVKDFKSIKDLYAAICFLIQNGSSGTGMVNYSLESGGNLQNIKENIGQIVNFQGYINNGVFNNGVSLQGIHQSGQNSENYLNQLNNNKTIVNDLLSQISNFLSDGSIHEEDLSIKSLLGRNNGHAFIPFLEEISQKISPTKVSFFQTLPPLSFTNLVNPDSNMSTLYVANRSNSAQLLFFYASNSNQANITTIVGQSVETNGNSSTSNTCKPIGTMTIQEIKKYGYIGIYNNNPLPVPIEISFI